MVLILMIGFSAGIPDDRVVAASKILDEIKAGEPLDFDDCIIAGDLEISALKIKGPVHFNRTIFRNPVKANNAAFNSDAYFWNADFNDYADFQYANFNGYTDFRYADFNGYADFWGANFNGKAVFHGANFNRAATFVDVDFNDNAYFRNATFNIAYFQSAQFDKEAKFDNARFAGETSFESSQFKEDALFENASFKGELSLTRARYDKLFIRWYNITRLVYDDAAYMSLMKNFKDLGYYEDYDSCYFDYRRAHRDQYWPAVSGWEQFIRKKIDYPMELFYGYGTKPFNAFFFSLGIVLVFALFWWALGLGGPKDKTLAGLPPGEEWLDGGITDILGFSVTVFLSGTRFFIDAPALPRIEGRSRSMIKKAFILKRLLGALFSILFFIAISGTIVRAS